MIAMQSPVILMVGMSVRLSERPSRACTVSKWPQIGSQNLIVCTACPAIWSLHRKWYAEL